MSVKIGDTILLDSAEVSLCRQYAEARHKTNRNDSVKSRHYDKNADLLKMDLEGIAGELAFCKLFNKYPDLSLFTRSSVEGTDDGDVWLTNKINVDIKTTKYKFGRLVAPKWKKPTGMLFALMIGECPKYEFKGFYFQDDLIQPENLGDLGHGSGYQLDQSKLLEYNEVLEMMEDYDEEIQTVEGLRAGNQA